MAGSGGFRRVPFCGTSKTPRASSEKRRVPRRVPAGSYHKTIKNVESLHRKPSGIRAGIAGSGGFHSVEPLERLGLPLKDGGFRGGFRRVPIIKTQKRLGPPSQTERAPRGHRCSATKAAGSVAGSSQAKFIHALTDAITRAQAKRIFMCCLWAAIAVTSSTLNS